MSGTAEVLRRFDLTTVGADPGCDGSLDTFELFLEADLAGQPAAELYPSAAVHLEGCPDCREDYAGLRGPRAGGGGVGPQAGLKHVPHAWVSAGTPARRMTQPAVVPCSSTVSSTIPNTVPRIRSRSGRSAGSDNASAVAIAPRNPAQNMTCRYATGSRLGPGNARSVAPIRT